MRSLAALTCLAVLLAADTGHAAPRTAIELIDALALGQPGVSRREPLHSDAVEAQLVADTFRWPSAGSLVALPDGTHLQWTEAKADDKGWLTAENLSGGYVAWSVQSDERQVLLLEASGHGAVNVNGEWRTGDHYGFGWLSTPVKLRKGENHFLFRVGRPGRVRASLLPPATPYLLDARDPELPTLVAGAITRELAAVVIENATSSGVDGLRLEASLAGGRSLSSRVPFLPELAAMKVPFVFEAVGTEPDAKLPLELRLLDAAGALQSTLTLDVVVVSPESPRVVTFFSGVDGSVQNYGLQPAWPSEASSGPKALVVSTHGAGVRGLSQARSYAPKSWAHVIGPTNRRRYGFDWEDWGRLDALEALAHARATLGTDPHRQYLTGHSMGGHGAWQLGVTFPDQWAVVGPSAGWISFRSYAGSEAVEHASPEAELLDRAWRPSDTLALVENLDDLGVYVLHGADDDNVPPTEARKMKEVLEGRKHPDFHYHEEPGQGHWWNLGPEPGSDCVDWLPLFDLMARRAIPASPLEVTFVTAHPGVSARSHWAEIVAVERSFVPARISIKRRPMGRAFIGETENVSRLALDLDALHGEGDVLVELDGRSFTAVAPQGRQLLLERRGDDWVSRGAFPDGDKSAARCGPFRDAFRNRALLVYGTRGTRDENAWALARARLDQETFRYRGNGSFEVVPDSAFRPEAERDRNVILYGGRHVNAAWDSLLADSPVSVERESVRIGTKVLRGEDLAVLLVRPRRDSSTASVGVVAGTGLPGARLTDRIPYFVSGIAYPDLTVLDSSCLAAGPAGIVATAFFGNDWSLEAGELAIRR